jgi:hypothetical protein
MIKTGPWTADKLCGSEPHFTAMVTITVVFSYRYKLRLRNNQVTTDHNDCALQQLYNTTLPEGSILI